MKAMKFRVESPEHSKQIQERLFEMGYKWKFNGQEKQCFNAKYLFTDIYSIITESSSEYVFNDRLHTETTLSDIMPKLDKLPESFGIMRDADNPLWDKYIAWLRKNNHSNTTPHGLSDWYYGVIDSDYYRNTRNGNAFGTILTLEQWDSIVNRWQPKNAEEIEVRENYKWIKAEFIGMDGKLFVCCTKEGYRNYKEARQINPIRKEIERLKDRIKELEGRL